ncbi:hypothetical protein P0Y35_01840 [Kiritimatiellaeota bacterium B1221]|nr:hypothetical protein [Kiritimatiellaeota bacterium B1221]
MKTIDLLPSLLNWTLVIVAILLSGSLISFLLVSLPIAGLEAWRVWRIRKEFGQKLNPVVIRQYYGRDHAFKWLPVKNQIQGLKKLMESQEGADIQEKHPRPPHSSGRQG